MRVDKFLKVSRLIKRRTVANDACDTGRISVNGKVVKASYNVSVGDIMEISLGEKVLKVEIVKIDEKRITKDDAPLMYRQLEQLS
jgi:ribosomal 50S subunit-recycling heat shock protein